MRKENQNTVPDTEATAVRSGKGKRLLIVLGVLIVLIVAAVVGGLYWHEQPSFCSTLCHSTMGPYYESYSDPSSLVGLHAEEGITCLDCHTPTTEDQIEELKTQVSGEVPDDLREREFPTAFCGGDDCHNVSTLAAMAELTAEMEPNPHENHAVGGAKCTLCHNMHRPQVTPCTECHEEGWGFSF